METTTRQVIITLWRDANIALIILYFSLLILNTVLNKFVQALLPLTGLGWLTALVVLGWLWFARGSTKT